jgi:hypothetical protein
MAIRKDVIVFGNVVERLRMSRFSPKHCRARIGSKEGWRVIVNVPN